MRIRTIQKKKNIRGLFIMITILILSLALILSGCSNNTGSSEENNTAADNPEVSKAKEIKKGESLEIPTDEISETAKFYPIKVEGTSMEVFAVKAPDGTIRTAFNTCQVCYDSGRGYYKQSGDNMICQNCGNQFPMDKIEVEANGCNPWPIFDKDTTMKDQSITISHDFLKKSKEVFANWKSNY